MCKEITPPTHEIKPQKRTHHIPELEFLFCCLFLIVASISSRFFRTSTLITGVGVVGLIIRSWDISGSFKTLVLSRDEFRKVLASEMDAAKAVTDDVLGDVLDLLGLSGRF